MRLSTNTIYAQGTRSILDQQTRVSQIGEQLATGKRINKPSDDPRGAAQLLDMQQSSQINDQYASTRSTAETQLSTEENQLNQVTNALDAAKQALVQAGNGTLSNADRDSLANQLDGVYQQVLSSANAKDGNGNAIFGGFASNATPFTGSAGNMVYSGDQGQRQLQVDSSRSMAVNDPGSDVFAAATANAKYIATAGSNTGSTTYQSLDVTDASASDYGDTFQLSFAGNGNSATYSVVDTTTGNTLVSNAAYQSGQAIALGGGLQTTIKGDPANGDSYTFAKGASRTTISSTRWPNTVAALRQPVDSDGSTGNVDQYHQPRQPPGRQFAGQRVVGPLESRYETQRARRSRQRGRYPKRDRQAEHLEHQGCGYGVGDLRFLAGQGGAAGGPADLLQRAEDVAVQPGVVPHGSTRFNDALVVARRPASSDGSDGAAASRHARRVNTENLGRRRSCQAGGDQEHAFEQRIEQPMQKPAQIGREECQHDQSGHQRHREADREDR